MQARKGGLVRQGGPGIGGELRQRVRDGIDPRGQVKPGRTAATIVRDGGIKPAAMIARSCHSLAGKGGWRVTKCPLMLCGQSRNGT